MNENEIKVLIFNLNGENYATDIIEVERILGYEVPTVLPDTPDFVEGVINYEGHILPIVSLAKRFNLIQGEKGAETKIIVVKQDMQKVGMIVDVVSEVKDIKSEDIESPPDIATPISKRYIKGLIKVNQKIVIFLNLGNILTDKEKKSII
ncbi:chemotaxis protein CheW [Clostridium algidicarnis]|uniref:Purine-binding chemotaxis protein CheW n=2 Tax=Clostridium algidicarnis TaxID=37659 RepID=A0A2S6G0P5_9CLOT|nr:chemotaxis protein CheW [Clostridium algidicarnis]MBB6630421.1 purine-binding chemotaxis protein CheW [Clostridium algidicarnis]MBB6696439.1 purine-binding chemotaxis protein CheW [Clostridium algidicarnis]MBU3205766.1 chemotaxis protein CheW [Clostridium algidicarnis]MBU3218524.1 chemotaxis protein CheW [Clostridium algidicarnis]MCB2286573.1 chemotaxis protein CheW [Clostridium algidicarnis]